jgi:hypothetical protein
MGAASESPWRRARHSGQGRWDFRLAGPLSARRPARGGAFSTRRPQAAAAGPPCTAPTVASRTPHRLLLPWAQKNLTEPGVWHYACDPLCPARRPPEPSCDTSEWQEHCRLSQAASNDPAGPAQSTNRQQPREGRTKPAAARSTVHQQQPCRQLRYACDPLCPAPEPSCDTSEWQGDC